jgi:hypothetical protein
MKCFFLFDSVVTAEDFLSVLLLVFHEGFPELLHMFRSTLSCCLRVVSIDSRFCCLSSLLIEMAASSRHRVLLNLSTDMRR